MFLSRVISHDQLVIHMQKHSDGQESIYFVKYVIEAMQEVRERDAEAEAKKQVEVWKKVKDELQIAQKDMEVKLEKIRNEIDELENDVKYYKERASKEKKKRRRVEKKHSKGVDEVIELNEKVNKLKRKLLENEEESHSAWKVKELTNRILKKVLT